MFVTTHVLAGAALGLVTRHPLLGLAAGAASHLALDAVPHWGDVAPSTFLTVAVVDGLLGVAVLAAAVRATPRALRLRAVAGITGAVVPDLDKPAVLFLGVNPFPAAVERAHGAVQREAAGWWWVEVLAGALLATAVVALLRRAREAASRRQ